MSTPKTDALRAMREAKAAAAVKAAAAKYPNAMKSLATRGEDQKSIHPSVVEQPAPTSEAPKSQPQKKVEKKATEAAAKARTGQKQLNVWLDEKLVRDVKVAATEDGCTLERWVAEAFEDLLKARAKGGES